MTTSTRLANWRRQRHTLQQLLQHVLTGSLCGIRRSELSRHIESLCMQLIDYVSIGHRCIYSPSGSSRKSDGLVHNLQRQIGNTTDRVLAFNRKYETGSLCASSESLHSDLLRLHRHLSMRFTLEEQWIELGRAPGAFADSRRQQAPERMPLPIRDSTRHRGYWPLSSSLPR